MGHVQLPTPTTPRATAPATPAARASVSVLSVPTSLSEALAAAPDDGGDIVIDLRTLGAVQDTDLAAILEARRVLHARGAKLILRSSAEQGGRVLQILAGMESAPD